MLILGNGAFKPNISTQVGGLYAPGDPRRDRAYLDLLRRHQSRRVPRAARLRHARRGVGWHYGFAAAGVGMMIGLVIYLYALPMLPPDELHKAQAAGIEQQAARPRRMARDPRAARAVRADHVVLGDLRAAGQHHRAVGRRQHRPLDRSLLLARRDPDHLVPGLQPVHDLRLHAVRRRAVGVAGAGAARSPRPSPRWRSAASASRSPT